MIDFDAIHSICPLAEYCLTHGIELRRHGNNLVGLCPLYDESGPSFTVYPDQHFHCFGCGARGDIIDLDRALYGGSTREAAERLAGQAVSVNVEPLPRIKKVSRPAYQLTAHDISLIKAACDRLKRAPELPSRVRMGLPLGAVRAAAEQGYLGFCPY